MKNPSKSLRTFANVIFICTIILTLPAFISGVALLANGEVLGGIVALFISTILPFFGFGFKASKYVQAEILDTLKKQAEN